MEGGRIRSGGELVAEGRVLEAEELAMRLEEQRRRIDRALHDFTENTLTHLREEGVCSRVRSTCRRPGPASATGTC